MVKKYSKYAKASLKYLSCGGDRDESRNYTFTPALYGVFKPAGAYAL